MVRKSGTQCSAKKFYQKGQNDLCPQKVAWKQGKKLVPTREIVPLGHVRTAKAKIRLHGCAVWSQPMLFTNRIIDYHRMDQQRAKAQMRLYHLRRMILCPVCACSKMLFCLTWLKWLIHNSRWADKHFSVFQQKSIFWCFCLFFFARKHMLLISQTFLMITTFFLHK